MVRSLCKSADIEDNHHETWEPMHGISHMRGHFGVVFHAQSNGEVTVQIANIEDDHHVTWEPMNGI